jgi:hypothetical protein
VQGVHKEEFLKISKSEDLSKVSEKHKECTRGSSHLERESSGEVN